MIPIAYHRRFVVCAAMTAVLGCKLTKELEPESVPMKEIIAVEPSVRSISANGSSTVRLSARIPAASSIQTVTFFSTAGVFLESGGKEVKVFAAPDPDWKDKRLATTLLRSDTLAAVAIVRATVGDFYDTTTVAFTIP